MGRKAKSSPRRNLKNPKFEFAAILSRNFCKLYNISGIKK